MTRLLLRRFFFLVFLFPCAFAAQIMSIIIMPIDGLLAFIDGKETPWINSFNNFVLNGPLSEFCNSWPN